MLFEFELSEDADSDTKDTIRSVYGCDLNIDNWNE